jgi:hypothetical protein
MTAAELWDQLHDLFDTNDGSLPDIEINNLSGKEVADVYVYLRSRSRLSSKQQYFWSVTEDKSVSVNSVVNAAELVVTGEASVFHIVVQGLTFGGATIPDLGIFIFTDSIGLDYRMGPEWGAAELNALFLCFCEILKIAPSAEITLPPMDYGNDRFILALRQYQAAA